MTPDVEGFFDPETNSVSYVVTEPHGRRCAIIDSVLDFDPKSGRTETTSADCLINYVRQQGLDVDWILQTHAHADHLSAAPYLKKELGGRIAIGRRIIEVQEIFKKVFNTEETFTSDGSQFDHLFDDGETFKIGSLTVQVMHTPGHTPACVTYIAGEAAFIGDTLFAPDYGTARADFPGGDAATLYRSIRKILGIKQLKYLYLCHDYPPDDRPPKWQSTVVEQRAENVHIHDGINEADYVLMRTDRDKTLAVPKLLFASIQVNMRAGNPPPPDDNGVTYLKIPLNSTL